MDRPGPASEFGPPRGGVVPGFPGDDDELLELLARWRRASVGGIRAPQARIRALPGCGHVPMIDDPALVADILLQGSGRLAGQATQG